MRIILGAIGFDEHRLLTFRLEDKWIGYCLFAEQCGVPMARTAGLNTYVRHSSTAEDLVRALSVDFGEKYVIKPVLGAGSGDSDNWDRRGIESTEFTRLTAEVEDERETYIVQERIAIVRELRVHTIEDQVLPGMTFSRYGFALDAATFEAVERFTAAQLDALPDVLIADSLYGWDIAQTENGWTVIEINPTGFHPEWCRGYQTTGFVQTGPDANANLATLINAIEDLYSIRIDLAEDDELLVAVNALRGVGRKVPGCDTPVYGPNKPRK